MYKLDLALSMTCIDIVAHAGDSFQCSSKTPQGLYDKLLKYLLTEHYEYEGRETVEYLQVPNEDALLPALEKLASYIHKYMVDFHREHHDFDFAIKYPKGTVVEMVYPKQEPR